MGFLSPITALIAASIVIPTLVALYFLKLRRRQVAVASTLLWKKAIQDMQVNAPFQRLRKNLLLLLQLLLLAALLIAMARPTTEIAARPGQRVVVVIDHSGSMNATDAAGGESRLDAAHDAALGLIDSLGASGEGEAATGGAMVVSFADQARVVQPFTGDLARLRDAVRRIEPTDQGSNLAAALRLVEPFALQAGADSDSGLIVYVLSDGRMRRVSSQPLALRGADLRYLPMGGGEAPHNLGIVSFSARRDLEKPQVVQVFGRLANYGPQPVTANVTLRLDGNVHGVQRVQVPPAGDEGPGTQSLQFDFVLQGAGLVELSHDQADMLAADDAARLTLAPARRLRVLLVTQGNGFLERVIRSVGVRELVLMSPDKYENQDPEALRRGGWDTAGTTASVAEGFDVIVFDGYAAQRVPPVNSLTFGAAPPIDDLQIVETQREAVEGGGGSEDEPAAQASLILDWQRDHPLMRYVALDDVIIQDAGRIVVPPDGQVLAVGQSGPVIAEAPAGGGRHVVTSFDVLRSNWPLFVSFPVFVTNSVQSLGLGGLAEEAGLMYTPGEVAVVPAEEDASLRYTGPETLDVRVVGGEGVLPTFRRVGVYTADGAVAPPHDRLPVNLLDPVESDIRPVEQLEVGTSVVDPVSSDKAIRREVWHWFVWAALALLMLEWVVYTRRMHL